MPCITGSTEENSSSRRRTSSSSKGPSLPDETPAVQLANSIAEQREPAVETPAVQLANSIAEQQEPAPSTPAVELANKQYEDRRQQQQPPGTRNPASGQGSVRTPADLLNDGIRAAASTAQEAVARSAESAQEGIALASSLTTQGITAAQSAADETVTNLASAAEQRLTQGIAAGEQILTGAATAVGGAAGAVDGVASAARTGSGRTSSADKGSGGAATLTGSFDSVNVRVPANMAWANPNPTRGPIRSVLGTLRAYRCPVTSAARVRSCAGLQVVCLCVLPWPTHCTRLALCGGMCAALGLELASPGLAVAVLIAGSSCCQHTRCNGLAEYGLALAGAACMHSA